MSSSDEDYTFDALTAFSPTHVAQELFLMAETEADESTGSTLVRAGSVILVLLSVLNANKHSFGFTLEDDSDEDENDLRYKKVEGNG